MVAYDDLTQINQLYAEQQAVQSAIAMIDGGGTISSVMIAPPPYDPANPAPMPMMAVNIALVAPAPPELMAAVRAQLAARDSAIAEELTALGVDDTPVYAA
jgi:hypothetical protein